MCASLMVDYWSLNVVLLFIKVSYTVLLELLKYPLSKYSVLLLTSMFHCMPISTVSQSFTFKGHNNP